MTSLTTSAMTVTAGHALAVCSCDNVGVSPTAGLTITDSQADIYGTQAEHASGASRAQWDLATNVAGGSTTWTVTSGISGFLAICAQEYSGTALAPVEAIGATGGTNQTPNPGSLLPPSIGDLYLSAWTHGGSASETFTPNTGWTLRSNLTNTANMPLGSEELIGSGLQVGSATLSGASVPYWDCVAMALRAADVAAPDDGNSPNFIPSTDPLINRGFRAEG